jgi:CopG-like RHH_1 or ribbon-helix-helix domain, RHH_5
MKQETKRVTFDMPLDLYELLSKEADKEERTISGQLIYIVKKFFNSAA